MHVRISSAHSVEVRQDLMRQLESSASSALARFADQITLVDVHLSDENGAKTGGSDKRCLIEARPAGRHPVAASDTAATVEDAFDGALKKLMHLLVSAFGKDSDHRGGQSVRTDQAGG